MIGVRGIFVTISICVAYEIHGVVITIGAGKLRGDESPRAQRVKRFLGVPYADPPERFEKATKVSPWEGIRNATQYGPACYQVSPVPTPLSEDCLTLDIYTPADLNDRNSNKAVMVFIHGGGFIDGYSWFYEGSVLSDVGDVVVVVMQYRLGIFGFLYTGGLKSSNLGLWDQRLALEWVRDNIKHFGGDNSKITVFGESAGSISISYLMISPLIDSSLFQRAILQSGTLLSGDIMKNNQFKPLNVISEGTNCTTSSGADIDCLKDADVSTLMSVSKPLQFFPFWPQVDNELVPFDPKSIITQVDRDDGKGLRKVLGSVPKYDTLMGITGQEGLYMLKFNNLPPDSYVNGISEDLYHGVLNNFTLNWLSNDEALTQQLTEHMAQAYLQASKGRQNLTEAQNRLLTLIEVIGDYTLAIPTVLFSRLISSAVPEKRSYFYVFDHKPEKKSALDIEVDHDWFKTSANHADELWFLFDVDTLAQDSGFYANFSMRELELSKDLMRYWSNFAKTGNPNIDTEGSGFRVRETWKMVSPNTQSYLQITAGKDLSLVNPGKEWDDFLLCIWSSLYREMKDATCLPQASSAYSFKLTTATTKASILTIIITNDCLINDRSLLQFANDETPCSDTCT